MISIEVLRQRIEQAGAWSELATVLNASSPEKLAQTADDQLIFDAFTDLSLTSEPLRSRLHSYPLPSEPTLNSLNEPSLRYHLAGGLARALEISEIADRYGFCFDEQARILDFNGGASAVLRFFLECCRAPKYSAVDASTQAIAYGQDMFPMVAYSHCGVVPPLGLGDRSFDLIYATSGFTHYREDLQIQWLNELYRLLAPGGLLIVAVQGQTLLDRCQADLSASVALRFPIQHFSAIGQAYQEDGYFNYNGYSPEALTALGLDPATYGISFITQDYIQHYWTLYFELLEYQPGGAANWQDYVVLRKREATFDANWHYRKGQWEASAKERVKLAQRLGSLYPSPVVVPDAESRAIAEATIEQLKSALAAAELREANYLAQIQQLQEEGLSYQQQLSAAQNEFSALQTSLKQTQANLKQAQANLKQTQADLKKMRSACKKAEHDRQTYQEQVTNLMNSRWRKLGRQLGIVKAVPWE